MILWERSDIWPINYTILTHKPFNTEKLMAKKDIIRMNGHRRMGAI